MSAMVISRGRCPGDKCRTSTTRLSLPSRPRHRKAAAASARHVTRPCDVSYTSSTAIDRILHWTKRQENTEETSCSIVRIGGPAGRRGSTIYEAGGFQQRVRE